MAPERGKATERPRKSHCDALRKFYFSKDIIGAFKSRRIPWDGHIEHMKDMRNILKILI